MIERDEAEERANRIEDAATANMAQTKKGAKEVENVIRKLREGK